MTPQGNVPPGRPPRGRRAAAAVGLVLVFVGGLGAGLAVADPGALSTALAAATGTASPAPAASPRPGASGAPAASARPATTPVPTRTQAPDPTPSPVRTAPPTATPVPTVPPRVAARLDRALERARSSLQLPGVEATVLFPDGSSWTGTLGYADVAEKRRVTRTTPFAIASVTKTFTAALVLRYVDQGLLELDDPLARWVPEWPNAKRITIRMLLNHTSGIPDFFQSTKFEKALNKSKKRTWTAAEVLAAYVRPGVVFAPGAGWSYSNTNYVLLGMVAERIGDAPWDVLVHRDLLAPLGLTSTYVQGIDDPSGDPALAYRVSVTANGGTKAVARSDGTAVVPFTSVVTAAGSAGAMASTTRDLARWAKALYGGQLLTRATRKEMLTFVTAYAYGLGTRYGLGVSRVRMQDRIAYGHTGALAGTRASIRYFPKDKVAIAVLFNRENYVGDDVTRILARALFPKPPASPTPTP